MGLLSDGWLEMLVERLSNNTVQRFTNRQSFFLSFIDHLIVECDADCFHNIASIPHPARTPA